MYSFDCLSTPRGFQKSSIRIWTPLAQVDHALAISVDDVIACLSSLRYGRRLCRAGDEISIYSVLPLFLSSSIGCDKAGSFGTPLQENIFAWMFRSHVQQYSLVLPLINWNVSEKEMKETNFFDLAVRILFQWCAKYTTLRTSNVMTTSHIVLKDNLLTGKSNRNCLLFYHFGIFQTHVNPNLVFLWIQCILQFNWAVEGWSRTLTFSTDL